MEGRAVNSQEQMSPRKAQGILDYVFLLAIVIIVLMLVGYYVRNSLAGKWRETADNIAGGAVYRPFNKTTATETGIPF